MSNKENNSKLNGRFDREDQRDIDVFVEAVETDARMYDSLTEDQKEVFRFGAAIREVGEQNLPASSQGLREALEERLSQPPIVPTKEQKSAIQNSTWLTTQRMAMAACLLLALGLIALMVLPESFESISLKGGISNIDALGSGDDDAKVSSILRSNEMATISSVTNIPTQSAHPPVTQSESVKGVFLGGVDRFEEEDREQKVLADGSTDKLKLIEDQLGRNVDDPGADDVLVRGFHLLQDLPNNSSPDPDQLASNEAMGKVLSLGITATPTDHFGFNGKVGFFVVPNDADSLQRSNASGLYFETLSSSGQYFRQGTGQGEQYAPIHENQFLEVNGQQALSTFSVDVDTASYSNMRRFLNNGQRPPLDSIRIEELVNYFDYQYSQPEGEHPFSVDMELANCPWDDQHHLLRVGIKGKEVHQEERSPSNLVFLLDVSGSMQSQDKLPLLKQGLKMMVQQLTENDSVSIVTYAGNAGVALTPTNGARKREIEKAIEQLNAGGSTNGSAGINMAYELAKLQFIKNGVNRVILATDGDLNVGVTSDDALVKLIKDKASQSVFLTVLGFGTGNLKDSKLEKLADNGNGMYAYIDSNREAHKVLVEQISGSLETIAKDVKLQVEFNPGEVKSYRLIGYENRVLATKDFDDDRKDAGEIGAGHTVTALYELVLAGSPKTTLGSDTELKYQEDSATSSGAKGKQKSSLHDGEFLTLSLRYKQPDENQSQKIQFTLKNEPVSFSAASSDFQFAAAVASFGMILRNSQHRGKTSLNWVEATAARNTGADLGGYRVEFLDLVRRAKGFAN